VVAQQAQENGRMPPPQQRAFPRSEGRGNHNSLSESVRKVQRTTGGQVLGAERVQFDGRDINRVKYVDDRGRVRYMDMDDAQGGRRSDSPVRPRRDIPSESPARGDNPSYP
jgi:type IV secretory pathway protease TraF